ncbi:hypothetical protein [Streptomyces endophytica]|uniref:Secreted protein n=1 Tax=Streptomyces endophytica TaxID=2991496 RepID=A0ABY6PC25_9ACTN|nr:hypothetical protein [Streptomyces endophytica]UZJ31380.1 hypothetical protein OJ254_15010 [Streptomyces endophytica]
MLKTTRRLAAATGVLLTAATLPLVATGSAQATTKQCTSFIAEGGYKVGPKVRAACKMTGEGGFIVRNNNIPFCAASLTSLGIKWVISQRACELGTAGPSGHI